MGRKIKMEGRTIVSGIYKRFAFFPEVLNQWSIMEKKTAAHTHIHLKTRKKERQR